MPRLRSLRALPLVVLIVAAGCTSADPKEDPIEQREVFGDCDRVDELVRRTQRGYVPVRSPKLIPIPREPNYLGPADDPVHTGPWDYLAEVPLVMYGPGHIQGRGGISQSATLADVAPTIAALAGFEGFRAPDGRPIDGVVSEGAEPPKLVVTIVWDGAGRNVLARHEGRWPNLERLIARGVDVRGATIGSSPSNTPPIHTTLGTGAFPEHHGIPHVRMETATGEYVDPFEGNVATRVKVPTLGDVYDETLDNEPVVGVVATVNWHLGMIGHGAEHPGGDLDPAALLDDRGRVYGAPSVYRQPDVGSEAWLQEETDELDAADGRADGLWMDHDLSDPALRYSSPAFVAYQERVLEQVVETEGFGADGVTDLLYVNFKQPDDAGHRFGMTSPEVGILLEAVDDALGRMAGFLDRTVGKRGWVTIVTADHGQSRRPEQSGGWPIHGGELKDDMNEAFDDDDGTPLVRRITSAGIFVDEAELAELALSEVARWLLDYAAEDNLSEGDALPRTWEGRRSEPLFEVVMAGRKVVDRTC